MIDLYDSYVASAELVWERIHELDEMISEEVNCVEREKLIIRRDLLNSERYDMLSVAESFRPESARGDFR